MKNACYFTLVLSFIGLTALYSCNNKARESSTVSTDSAVVQPAAGYETPEKLGEHLVLIGGCHDCHSPKKMTPQGPEIDFSLALSGHPSQMPIPDIDRKEMESKGVVATQTLTSWIGPWGVSYAANLTSDATGIGEWEEANFMTAIRKGKHKGVETERTLLPPMPWQMYNNMTDEELKAIFAYLKSTKPIKNIVPQPLPPVLTAKP
ncbi:cytochrome c [Flavihumibacter sp. R14]|nr:cytochrome c [Flavihumibacter soli]